MTQLSFAEEVGRDDQIDVVVYDLWGRLLDVIPAHLGDRLEQRDRCSLHEAMLWAGVAAERARRWPPTWATFPCHDAPGPDHCPLDWFD